MSKILEKCTTQQITYSPELAYALCSLPAAILVSWIADLQESALVSEEGVGLSTEDICFNTWITPSVLRKAKTLLTKHKILVITKKLWHGNELVNEYYYRIDGDVLDRFMTWSRTCRDAAQVQDDEVPGE